MPTFQISWTARVTGVTRVEADNADEAEQALCHDTDPPVAEADLSDVEVLGVEEV